MHESTAKLLSHEWFAKSLFTCPNCVSTDFTVAVLRQEGCRRVVQVNVHCNTCSAVTVVYNGR